MIGLFPLWPVSAGARLPFSQSSGGMSTRSSRRRRDIPCTGPTGATGNERARFVARPPKSLVSIRSRSQLELSKSLRSQRIRSTANDRIAKGGCWTRRSVSLPAASRFISPSRLQQGPGSGNSARTHPQQQADSAGSGSFSGSLLSPTPDRRIAGLTAAFKGVGK